MRIYTKEEKKIYDEIFATYNDVIKPLLAQVEVIFFSYINLYNIKTITT